MSSRVPSNLIHSVKEFPLLPEDIPHLQSSLSSPVLTHLLPGEPRVAPSPHKDLIKHMDVPTSTIPGTLQLLAWHCQDGSSATSLYPKATSRRNTEHCPRA